MWSASRTPGRLLTVPLTLRNQPAGRPAGPDAPRQVTLTLNGPADELDHVALADVTASVDLSHARPGKRVSLPVQVKAPDDLQASASPDTVTLDLLPRQTRRLAVAAADPGPALPGYRFLPPRITPRLVTVSGGPDDVASVARLVARVDASAVGTIDDDYDIVALDAQGGEVPGVTLSPPRAHVTIRMVRAPAQKNVLVSADITGAPSPASRVGSIEVHPLHRGRRRAPGAARPDRHHRHRAGGRLRARPATSPAPSTARPRPASPFPARAPSSSPSMSCPRARRPPAPRPRRPVRAVRRAPRRPSVPAGAPPGVDAAALRSHLITQGDHPTA